MHIRTKIVIGVAVAAGLYWFVKSRAAAKKREMQERGRGRAGEILSSTPAANKTESWVSGVVGGAIETFSKSRDTVVVGRSSNDVGIARFKARLK